MFIYLLWLLTKSSYEKCTKNPSGVRSKVKNINGMENILVYFDTFKVIMHYNKNQHTSDIF